MSSGVHRMELVLFFHSDMEIVWFSYSAVEKFMSPLVIYKLQFPWEIKTTVGWSKHMQSFRSIVFFGHEQ
jgi:hypothetical protein